MKKKNKRKKNLREIKKRTLFNLRLKKRIKSFLKKFRFLVSKNEKEKAIVFLPRLYQILDKAAKQGVIKKGSADRKKSQMAKLLTGIEKKK